MDLSLLDAIRDNAINTVAIEENTDGIKVNDFTTIQYIADGAIAQGDIVIGGVIADKQNNPSTLPSRYVNGIDICEYNGDLYHACVWGSVSPYMCVYKFSGGAWTKMADPATIPNGLSQAASLCVFNNNLYLAVCGASTYALYVYKLVGDIWEQMTNITAPSVTLADVHFCVANSALYLAACANSSPFIFVYRLDADTWTKLPDPDIKPASQTTKGSMCVYNNELYIAVSHSTAPRVTVYKIVSDVLVAIDTPSILPSNSGYSTSLYVYNNILYMALSCNVAPYIVIYKYVSNAWVQMESTPDIALSTYLTEIQLCSRGTSYGSDFYLLCASSVSPYLLMYRIFDDKMVSLTNLNTALTGTNAYSVREIHYNNNDYIFVGHYASPYINNFIMQPFKVSTLDGPNVSTYEQFTTIGVAQTSATDGQTITIAQLRD